MKDRCCRTCGAGVAALLGGECRTCYQYRRRTGEERPERIIVRTARREFERREWEAWVGKLVKRRIG